MENKKVKKIPLRRCLGCMESYPKKELIRVVRTPEGDVCIDLTGKKSGRGAYICKSEACLKKAIKSKRIQSNLEITLSEELVEALTKELKGEDK
ncbi:MAG: YlxR family protein [Clostridia bacterium]|nr:YlxR family protein [Clostridia bacterium]